MRQARSGSTTRTLLGGLVLAALVPAAWAYVNGGDFHDSRKTFERKMKSAGWGISIADGAPRNREVNLLVGQALQNLPEKQADKVPAEVKREVARLASEAIRTATLTGKEVIKKGQIGGVEYQVGSYQFETYWETNYNRGREIHARRTGLEPFVALKVQTPKPPDKN